MRDLYDVIEISMEKPYKVTVLDTLKSAKNADAIMKMAVVRKGVVAHFFKRVPNGEYRDGDSYRFNEMSGLPRSP